MIRTATIAWAATVASFVKKEMMAGANESNITDTSAINIALYFAVLITESSARCGCSAPRFCPTRVAAALLIPHAGNKKNMMSLMAIWYPAEASLWPVVTTRAASTIQLPDPIKNCKVAGQAMSTMERMIVQSGTRCFSVNWTSRLPLNK